MQDLKQMLSDEMRVQLSEHLIDQVNRIVREIIQREIAGRVRHQVRRRFSAKPSNDKNNHLGGANWAAIRTIRLWLGV